MPDANFGLPIPFETFGGPVPTYSHISTFVGRTDMYVDGVGGVWADGNAGNGEVIPSAFLDFYSLSNVVQDGHVKSSVLDYIPTGQNDNWQFISEDPVRLTYVIPEPMTMVAIGLAIGGLGGYLRKRRA